MMLGKRGSQPGSPRSFASPIRLRSHETPLDYASEMGARDVLTGEQKAVVVLVNKVVSKVCPDMKQS
jgi:hypothetical protein